MQFFINAFMAVLGVGAGVVVLYLSAWLIWLSPYIIGHGIRLITTRRWQVTKAEQLRAQGNHSAVAWMRDLGMATKESDIPA